MTHQPDDGAFAGDYKVVLKVWSDYRSQESPIPREYGDESATPLSATVDKDNRKFDFSVPR